MFNVGDKVVCIDPPFPHIQKGTVFTVCGIDGDPNYIQVKEILADLPHHSLSVRRFVKVEPKSKMLLPEDPKVRKGIPITSGVLDYFPKALAMVAMCSKAGNDQHNPGQPLHWDKSKSGDHADCIARHLIDRRSTDTDGIPHAVKLAWRALANLETMIENGEVKL